MFFFFFQAEDGIRDIGVTGVQTCALPICNRDRVASNYIRTNLGTEINPIKDLSINFDYTFSMLIDAQKRDGGTITAYDMFATSPFSNYKEVTHSSHNRVVQTSKYTMSNIFKAYATYLFRFNDVHNFKVMGGMDA